MLTNLELYGTEDVPPINRTDALARVTLLQKRIKYLTDLPLREQNSFYESKVIEAINFWHKMANLEDTGL